MYGASSLKQQSADRHAAPLGHIILISSQQVFVLSLLCRMFSGETTHTNCLVFGLTRSGLEPTIYHTGGGRTDFICQMTMKWNCESKAVTIWQHKEDTCSCKSSGIKYLFLSCLFTYIVILYYILLYP
jgi:hypothetical protein